MTSSWSRFLARVVTTVAIQCFAVSLAIAAPTLSFSASPAQIAAGGTSQLSWTASRPSTCIASGGWSGAKTTSGNQRTPALNATTTFTLTCSNSTGSIARSVTITVVPPPTLVFGASPSTINAGASTTLSWSTTNATSCKASGAWTGTLAVSGSKLVAPSATSTYTLACSGTGGSVSKSVTVTVTAVPPPPPVVSLAANPTSVVSGSASILTWSATNATVCTASGGWSGTRATSGSFSTGALVANTPFMLTCSGVGGSGSASVTVGVSVPAPSVTLTANPTQVASGGKSTLTWSVSNATSCTASGGWTGTKAAAGGAEPSAALTAKTSFSLACVGPGGNGSATTLVSVGSFAALPALANLANGTAIDLGLASCTDVLGEYDGYCRLSFDYSGMVYDSRNHMILNFGGGHAATMSDSVHAMDFKLGTNWSDLYTPTPCSAMTAANVDTTNAVWLSGPAGSYPRPLAAHTYGLVRYAPEQNELVLLGRRFTKGQVCGANISNDLTGPIAHFNLGTRIWSFSTDAATTNLSAALPASDYDPVSKKMVILGSGGLVLYDPGTRQSSGPLKLLASTNGVPFDTESRFVVYADHMVYYPPNDRFYYFARNGQVFELALNRSNPAASTIDDIATTGPNPSSQGEFGFAFDSKNSVIGGGVSNGAFYIFTPQTRTWSAVPIPGGSPGPMAFHMIVYDPINNVFVFRTTYEAGQRTWAFRYRN